MDENGNATKIEHSETVAIIENGHSETSTTVTIEKTVTTVIVTSDDAEQGEYEDIGDDETHVYAEVYRDSVPEVRAEVASTNNNGGNEDPAEDYVNVEEIHKEETVTVDKVSVVSDLPSNEEHNADSRPEREAETVSITVVKTEVLSGQAASEKNDQDNDESGEYINNTEVTGKVSDFIDVESTYDPVLSVGFSTLSAQGADDHDSAELETRAVSVTISKTEVTSEEQDDKEERETMTTSVTVTKTTITVEKEEGSLAVDHQTLAELEPVQQEDQDSLQERLERRNEAFIKAVESNDNDSVKSDRENILLEDKGKLEEAERILEINEEVEDRKVEATPALHTVTVASEVAANKVELKSPGDQQNDVKTPTLVRSPSSSGMFVLRNARQKDAMHFMQQVRTLASGPTNDLEKGQIMTILRSTSKDETVKSENTNKRASVTTDLVRQFEVASAGGGAVFPKSSSAGIARLSSVEAKQLGNINPLTSDRKQAVVNETDVKLPANTVVESTKTTKEQVEVKTVTVTKKEVKSSEVLAQELELKLQAKEELLRRRQEEEEVKKTKEKNEVTSNGISSTSSNAESLVRPSSLLRNSVVGNNQQQAAIVPQWQLELRERNRSKRVSTTAVSPTSPSQTNSATSPQTPPWVTQGQRN